MIVQDKNGKEVDLAFCYEICDHCKNFKFKGGSCNKNCEPKENGIESAFCNQFEIED
jgi:hypothetical protein